MSNTIFVRVFVVLAAYLQQLRQNIVVICFPVGKKSIKAFASLALLELLLLTVIS